MFALIMTECLFCMNNITMRGNDLQVMHLVHLPFAVCDRSSLGKVIRREKDSSYDRDGNGARDPTRSIHDVQAAIMTMSLPARQLSAIYDPSRMSRQQDEENASI